MNLLLDTHTLIWFLNGNETNLSFAHLPMHHRDPFDRLLIAQSMTENLLFITADANIHQYDVDWI